MRSYYRFCLYTILTLPIASTGTGQSPEGPDLIIHNARIYTVNTVVPWAEAVAIQNGRISAIGSESDILALKGSRTKIIDAGGHFVMPGFIEGHGHLSSLGNTMQNLNLLKTHTWQEIVDSVAQRVRAVGPGTWIVGRGWHQEKWTTTPEPNVMGYPYHTALSNVSPENPVILYHASGHALIANRAAMDAAGITGETPDPEGGHIVRDDSGQAIGVFEENAANLIQHAYDRYRSSLSPDTLKELWYDGVRLAEEDCLQKGITSFQDAGSSLEEIARYAKMAVSGNLKIRLWAMILDSAEDLQDKLTTFPIKRLGDGFFTCRAIKAYADGALGSRGAWMLKPYDDKPGWTGENVTPIGELSKLADLCAQHGLQFCVHAIGDRANKEVLDLYEKKFVQYQLSRDVRWRIEHAQHIDTTDIPRFAKLGVIASMQAIHCTSDAPFVVKRIGEERARTGAYAWRSLLNTGAVVTNGTDTPVEDEDPIPCFYAAVTRKRADNGMAFFPEQKLTRTEAIYSYTMANAYAAFEEDVKGSLVPGKYADIVILSNDLTQCAEDQILSTKVLMTIVNGVVRYRMRGF